MVMFSGPVSAHCITECAMFRYPKKVFDVILKIWNCKIKIHLGFHEWFVKFVQFFFPTSVQYWSSSPILLKHLLYCKHATPSPELAIQLERLLQKGILPWFCIQAHMYSLIRRFYATYHDIWVARVMSLRIMK